MALLEVRALQTHLDCEDGVVRAVDGVDLDVDRGETLALVGESGAGKTMVALSLMRLLPEPLARIVAGSIRLHAADSEPVDLTKLDERQLGRIRGSRIAMVFQDARGALNPYLTVGAQLGEVIERNQRSGRRAARARAVEMLRTVGIAAPEARVDEHPHRLSGGMCQRVMIAMALLCEPDLLIADEPTSAVDATVQAQILALLAELQRARSFGVLLITHDLAVVASLADRVAVMYAGKIVEQGAVADVLVRPCHPYTAALAASVLRLNASAGERPEGALAAEPPSPHAHAAGCAFLPRCPRARPICADEPPADRSVPSVVAGVPHRLRCHLEVDSC